MEKGYYSIISIYLISDHYVAIHNKNGKGLLHNSNGVDEDDIPSRNPQ